MKGQHLYRLLRAELVSHSPIPLSSDAFTNFGTGDQPTHNANVLKLLNFLHQELIPIVTQEIEEWKKKETETHVFSVDGAREIVNMLHRRGVNLFELEMVRSQLKDSVLQKLIFHEMSCRVLKNMLKFRLRYVTECDSKIGFGSEIIGFFKDLKSKDQMFMEELEHGINQAFIGAFKIKDLKTCLFALDFDFLFQRICNLMNILFHSGKSSNLYSIFGLC